jgi:DNA polymerase (family X)
VFRPPAPAGAMAPRSGYEGAMTPVDKAAVAKALRELSLYLQLRGESGFKTRAYDVASERVAGLTEDLGELVAHHRLTSLPGIGESIAGKITEIVTTGKMTALEEVRAQFPPRILDLLEVPDLGPKKAAALFAEIGVGSLDELEVACHEQRVRGLKGFGTRTEEKLLANLALARRQRSAGARHRLGDVLPQAETLLEWVKGAPGVVRASLGGSVRRRKETVADVDIIASAADSKPVFDHFLAFPRAAEVLGAGESKASIRLKEIDLQVDLRVLPDDDFASALHHFTGSKAHHIKLRSLALERGFTISEWGAYRTGPSDREHKKGVARHEEAGEKVPIRTEDELYRLLGLQPVPPELREDWGEIEAAGEKRLPSRLVSREDLRGNVHVHSTWSDGRNSLEAMAVRARELGFEYLTVTEHSRSSAYAGGLSIDRLRAQWDEIDRLNEKLEGIRLLKGVESDILEDGALDYPDDILEHLDLVIGSIHQRYHQDEEAMTRRVKRAFENPHFHVWGHPTGRLLLRRESAPMRMEELLDAACQHRVAIEVNGSPERMELTSDLVKGAIERGIRLVVSTDAHSTEELDHHLSFALSTARRGWAEKAHVLNTLDAGAFLCSLRRG